MRVDTARFGTIEIDDSSVIKMPRGPIGFEEQTDYCLIQHRPDTSFRWLQSTDEPSLAFVVIDPVEFFPDYEIELSDADAEKLHLQSADDALVLVIATVRDEGKDVTADLAAPLVINSKELVGMQVVLQDNRYSVKHSLVEQVSKVRARDTSDSEAVETKAA